MRAGSSVAVAAAVPVGLLLLILTLVGQCLATPMTSSLPAHEPISPNKRTLVLLDEPLLKNSSSKFFDGLSSKGFKLKFKKLSEGATVVLKTNGEMEYDHVIVFAGEKANPSDKSIFNLLEFIDAGGNVLFVTTGGSKWSRDLAQECGVKLGDVQVMDRFPPSDGENLAVPWPKSSPLITGEAPSVNTIIRYDGISCEPTASAAAMGATVALSATLTSYQAKSAIVGSKIALITSVQMLNNARVMVSGSIKQFDDASAVNNQEFNLRLALWTFAEASVLRVRGWSHRKVDGSEAERQVKHARHLESKLPRSHFPNPEWGPDAKLYRIRDEVKYELSAEISTFDGKWKPFIADDLQVEFAMLDPYQRRTLQGDGKGNYNATFRLPDQYGTFAFRLVYNRPGVSRLRILDSVNVRPYRHDEYERFIASAWPYYTAVGVVMAGFFIFSVSFVVVKKTHQKAE